MRKHLTNATYGVLDYVSYPVAMLLVCARSCFAGSAQQSTGYGFCARRSSVLVGFLLRDSVTPECNESHGFAGKKRLTQQQARSVRCSPFNLALGALFAILVWFAAPIVAHHVAAYHITSAECVYSLRISGAWILLRAVGKRWRHKPSSIRGIPRQCSDQRWCETPYACRRCTAGDDWLSRARDSDRHGSCACAWHLDAVPRTSQIPRRRILPARLRSQRTSSARATWSVCLVPVCMRSCLWSVGPHSARRIVRSRMPSHPMRSVCSLRRQSLAFRRQVSSFSIH